MGWLFWPFTMLWGLFVGIFSFFGGIAGLMIGAIGRLAALIMGFVVASIGVFLCVTIIGAIIGIPLVLCGGGLILKAIF